MESEVFVRKIISSFKFQVKIIKPGQHNSYNHGG